MVFWVRAGLNWIKKGICTLQMDVKLSSIPDLKKTVYLDASKNGNFLFLFSLKFDPDFKNLYISEFGTQTLLKYSINQNNVVGNPSVVITEPIKGASPYGSPLNIIFGNKGNIYVSIDNMNQLLKIKSDGNLEYMKLGLNASSMIANHIIAFGGKGFDEESIYLTTYDGKKIYKYKVEEKTAIK